MDQKVYQLTIDYLSHQVVTRNVDKYQELIGYLEKHQDEIIRPKGSRALVLLKVLELNGGWQDFWFPRALDPTIHQETGKRG
jgi:hypothetical protein